MRPAKKLPLHLLPVKSVRSYTRHTARSCSSAVFSRALLVLAAVLLTVVYFVAIRTHRRDLTFTQLSAFERQVQTVDNHTFYFVEPPRRDELLAFPRQDWARVSARIDYVVVVYDDVYALDAATWVGHIVAELNSLPLPSYGVALFPCGCIIPNRVFVETEVRFDGFECMLLPGFVIPNQFITFVDVKLPSGVCRRREAVLSTPWYDTYSWKLQQARDEHITLRRNIAMEQPTT